MSNQDSKSKEKINWRPAIAIVIIMSVGYGVGFLVMSLLR